MKVIRSNGLAMVLVCMTLMMASCGKSDDSSTPTPTGVDTTTVTGSVYAASVNGALVSVKDGSGNVVAGPVTAAADGAYSVDIPTSNLAGNLRFEATGGAFTDEATGLTTAAGRLAAYAEGGTLSVGSAVHLDPSSTIAHDLVISGAVTSVSAANTLFNSAFGYSPDLSVQPMNTAPTGTTNEPQRLKALHAAAFSQLVYDMNISAAKQFDLIAAIAQDLGDDNKLNGTAGSVNGTAIPEDIQNKFEHALVSYMSNTTTNMTELTTDEIGSLPFGKVVLTDTYRVEYIPGMMAASMGKTSFKIKITKRSDGTAATGLALKLMPMMYMATMSHSTPMDPITESATLGTYNSTAYYLMASGSGMGYWQLAVMIGSGMMGETATFYPAVGMAMGSDTIRATLKGQNDIISGMTGTEKLTYYLFKDDLVSGSTTTFNLFIAAKESMMSFPAVSIGTVLSSTTGTVTSMSVEASADGGSSWVPAIDNANGHWSVPGLTGLVSGMTGTIYVKMTVNAEDKTTDGNAVSGANGYATFIVKPASSGM